MKKIIYLSLFSLLLFLAAGCAKKEEQATTGSENPPAVAEERTDTGITTEVKVKITDDELLDNTDVSVETENGIVTLTGTVTNETQKERAKELAANTAGVKEVNNNLQIGEPKTVNLEDEKEKAEETIDDAVDKTKDVAEETADKTKDLAKKTGEKLNDATITSEVKLKLAGDDLTDALDIDVDTKNGVVTLTGNVSSQAEVDRAIQIARSVEDVTNVQSNLKIQADRY